MNEREKKELLELASSAALREEFRRLRVSARFAAPSGADLDLLLEFLTASSRLCAGSWSPVLPTPYPRALL